MAIQNFEDEKGEANPGSITIFSGALSEIPSGWALCDGNNGTPDLRGKMMRGIPDGTTSPGGGGGSDSYTLSTSQLPSHSHTGSVNSGGSHNHKARRHSYGGGGEGASGNLHQDNDGEGHGTIDWSTEGSHSHSLNIGSTGGGNSIDNKPKYYEVAYIMQL